METQPFKTQKKKNQLHQQQLFPNNTMAQGFNDNDSTRHEIGGPEEKHLQTIHVGGSGSPSLLYGNENTQSGYKSVPKLREPSMDHIAQGPHN